MKKILSLSLALMAGICASAQNVCTIDAKAWLTEKGAADPTALTAIDANSVIVDNEDVTVSTGAADQYKAVDIAFNGNTVQEGCSSDMLFKVDEIIAYISQWFTLKTGDILYTGTPAGVGPVHIDDHLTGWLEDRKVLEFNVK